MTPRVTDERLAVIAHGVKTCDADLPTLGEVVDMAVELEALRRQLAEAGEALVWGEQACRARADQNDSTPHRDKWHDKAQKLRALAGVKHG